jgi:hypothetical protein
MVDKNQEFSICRKLYKDIINGYTYVPYHKIYIKHFKEIDIGEINESKQKIIEDSKTKGLLSEKEKIDILIESDHWSQEKESEIQILEEQISNHRQAKTKLFLKAQLDAIQHEINKKQKKLDTLITEKSSIMGLTVEKHAEKKSSEEIIKFALFKDSNFCHPLHTTKEYEELEYKELEELINIYSEIMYDFSEKRIKMISAATFFMNALMLCKNNPFIFFGKPVCQLTNFQMEMFSYGLSFKNVLEKGNTPPVDTSSDLEQMVEWYESSGNIQRLSEKSKDRDGSTVMGASKKELRMMTGEGDQVIDLAKEAEKKGGELNIKDFVRIHSQ